MSSTDSLDLPIAAVVCLAVGSYVLLIGIILLVRYCLIRRGVCECSCSCGKEDAEDQQSCACCASLAECCNCCQPTTLSSCLDSICPNRKKGCYSDCYKTMSKLYNVSSQELPSSFQDARACCKRIGCVEILLCQCCGSEGAAGICACKGCEYCPSASPKCPCACDCNIDCSTFSCCCITVHIVASAHDPVMTFGPGEVISPQHIFPKSSPMWFARTKNNNLPGFTDLNDNVSEFKASPSIVSNVLLNQGFKQPRPAQYPQNQFLSQSQQNFAQYLQNDGLFSPNKPQVVCCESSTQTPRQFSIRRSTLRPPTRRKLKTARERYKPRPIRSIRIARNVMFDRRVVHSVIPAWR